MTVPSILSLVPTETADFIGMQTRMRPSSIAKSSAGVLATVRSAYKAQVRPKDPTADRRPLDAEAGASRFREGVIEVLDQSQRNTRTHGLWAKLHKQFFAPFLADLGTHEPNSIAAKARNMTIHHLWEEENPTHEKLLRFVSEAYENHAAYNAARIKLLGYHPKFQLLLWAAVCHENFIFLELEKTQGAAKSTMSMPEPLDTELSPEAYSRRFRDALIHARLVDRDLHIPQMLPTQLEVDQCAPMDLKPIWASRQLGMEPSIRSFPELASVITHIRAVDYLAPGKHAPPAILLHFVKPLYDVVAGRHCEQLAVALLKKPLPALAHPDEDERPYVDFNQHGVQALAFAENAALPDKQKILRQIFALAISERLLPRVGYSYYGLKGVRRFASLAGRSEQERNAVFQTAGAYLDLELAQSKEGLGFGRKPQTGAFQRELERKFQHWQKILPVLNAFGVPEQFLHQRTSQRIQMLAARERLLEIARNEYLGPCARILLSVVSEDQGARLVVHANDAKRLAQRMNNAADILLATSSQIGALGDSFNDDTGRLLFHYLINLSVFMSLPANPKKPFVRTLSRDIEQALRNQYTEEEQAEILNFLSQLRTELRIEVPVTQCRNRETLATGIQNLCHFCRFIRLYQAGHHDAALAVSDLFGPELNRVFEHVLRPIIQAKAEETRNTAEALVLQILDAAGAAKTPSAREALLPRIHDAKKSVEGFPDLVQQISDIENSFLPPKMKAAQEILRDPNYAQDLIDSRNAMLKRFLETVSQGRTFAKEEKVRRHVEAKVKRAPHLGGLHARVLIHLFLKNGSGR